MLRLQRRIDVVLLAGPCLVVIEFKVHKNGYDAVRQVEDYAFDLRDFHKESHELPILPVLCVPDAPNRSVEMVLPERGQIADPLRCNADSLGRLLLRLGASAGVDQIDLNKWASSPYHPVPTIIQAAELLYAGHQVREIAHAASGSENLGVTTDRLVEIIANAETNKKHLVVFVTGVPGSGKTLVGLNAIHDPRFRRESQTIRAFLSGNTPLITVLHEALARDQANRSKVKTGDGTARSCRKNSGSHAVFAGISG